MSARIAAAIFAALILFSAPVAMAAPIQIGQLPPHTERVVERAKQKPPCRNELVLTIYGAGFRGQNIKEAYAIAMRESNGIASTVSNQDYGLYQFNYPTWSGTFDWSRILDADYNARAAYKLSNGGKSWLPWGMRNHMEFDRASYGMWSDDQFYAWVIEPYQRYYAQFPRKCEK